MSFQNRYFKKSLWAVAALGLMMAMALMPKTALAQAWIQVASERSIRDTHARAQDFAASFPETRAFLTTSGWYAIVLGPFERDEALALMTGLKAQNQIPQDSMVSSGSSHVSQLWPLAANTEPGAQPDATADAGTDAGSETGTDPAATIGTVIIDEPAPEPDPGATEPPAGETGGTITEAEEVAITTPEPAAEPELPEEAAEIVDPDAPIPDPDLRATQANERGWTRDQKKQYQTYMVWTGDYDKAIDGSYGRGTRAAIRGFQEREGYETTGYLTETQVLLLKKRYDDIIGRLGVQTVRNLDAGIEMLMPVNLVVFSEFEPPFVHFKPRGNSDTRAMLISQEGGRDTLRSLYDIMETFDYIPPEGYRVRKRDWFVLSGRNDEVVSYTYARTTNGLVKGFTLVWKPERDSEMQPLVTAMYNSFSPLDNYVLDETLGFGQGDEEPLDLTTGIETLAPTRSASGFLISADGFVLTHSSNVESCRRITIGEDVDLKVVTNNPRMELAVLRPKSAYTPASFALFSDEAPQIGTEITVAGFSFPDVMEIAALNYGTLTATSGAMGNEDEIRVSAFLEAGDVGGPVLDDRGAVIGMQLLKPEADANLPEYVNFAIKSGLIMELLQRHGVTFGRSTAFDAVDAEDLAFMAGDFTVKVSCWN